MRWCASTARASAIDIVLVTSCSRKLLALVTVRIRIRITSINFFLLARSVCHGLLGPRNAHACDARKERQTHRKMRLYMRWSMLWRPNWLVPIHCALHVRDWHPYLEMVTQCNLTHVANRGAPVLNNFATRPIAASEQRNRSTDR